MWPETTSIKFHGEVKIKHLLGKRVEVYWAGSRVSKRWKSATVAAHEQHGKSGSSTTTILTTRETSFSLRNFSPRNLPSGDSREMSELRDGVSFSRGWRWKFYTSTSNRRGLWVSLKDVYTRDYTCVTPTNKYARSSALLPQTGGGHGFHLNTSTPVTTHALLQQINKLSKT